MGSWPPLQHHNKVPPLPPVALTPLRASSPSGPRRLPGSPLQHVCKIPTSYLTREPLQTPEIPRRRRASRATSPQEAGWARLGEAQRAASRQLAPARFPSGAPRVFPTPTQTIKTNYMVTVLICRTIMMFPIPLPNVDGRWYERRLRRSRFWPRTALFAASCFWYQAGTSNPALPQPGEAASPPSTAQRGQDSTRHHPAPLQHLTSNSPAQTSERAGGAADPRFWGLGRRARYASAPPEATAEFGEAKGRKLFIIAAHGNAISPARRQGAVLIYRLMNFK